MKKSELQQIIKEELSKVVNEMDITHMFTQLHPKDETLQQYIDILKKDQKIVDAAHKSEGDFRDALKRRIYLYGDKDDIGRTAVMVLQIDQHSGRYSGDNFGRVYKKLQKNN